MSIVQPDATGPGVDDASLQEPVDSFSTEFDIPITIPRHPRAAALYKDADPSKKMSDITYAEKTHFDQSYLDVMYRSFFNVDICNHTTEFSALRNNIRMYALYRLIQAKKIVLTSFDTSASMTNLFINKDECVIVPKEGAFVLTFNENTDVVLLISKYSRSIGWGYIGKNFDEFNVLEKMISDDIKLHNLYLNKVFDQSGEFISLPDVTFDDIYLDQDLRDEIQANIINYFDPKKFELRRKNGVPTKRGIIFAGDPGTGKTFLSRVLANTLNTTFMVVTSLQGAGELEFCMDFMKQFPNSIILFEDIDIYIPDRNTGAPIVSAMLNGLDGISVNENLLVLCTTNEPSVLDRAINDRPGRFDRTFKFEAPDKVLKTVMLKSFCSKNDCTAVDFDELISKIPVAHTGAHLKELYITAVTIALDTNQLDENSIAKLSTEIFIDALKKTSRNKDIKRRTGFERDDDDDE